MAYIGAGMRSIENKSLPQASGAPKTETRSTGSIDSSPKSGLGDDRQKNLSMSIAEHLLDLMKSVTKDSVSPKTVNAACQCASELHKLMKLNLEMRRRG